MGSCSSKKSVEIILKEGIQLSIYAEAPEEKNTLLDCTESNNRDYGEEPVQLMEGCFYEYKLSDKECTLHDSSGNLVKKSNISPNTGRISPGIYVGRLALTIKRNGEAFDETAVEIRSVKADYRTEYRKMLEDITKECTELLIIHSSPVTQRFTVDYEGDSKTLYQRFAFVKSIVDSDEFHTAVRRVISMPVTSWIHRFEERDIRRSRRINPSYLRQIASRKDRICLPENHMLNKRYRIESISSRLTTEIKTDTRDTPENRFIKYVLREFQRFCGMVCRHIENNHNGSTKFPNIYYEAKALETSFDEYLNHTIFREISNPSTLPLNSPVLQRKEGYREILRVWLMFDLAAKLTWIAMDEDQYQVGKRDVATLYEYWLFFKLLRLVEKIFSIKPEETKDLIQKTNDELGLQLKAGRHYAVNGDFMHKNRHLNVRFSYNRTFGKADYPKGGSWTKQMRPDYTLSLWPYDFKEKEAEAQELIVHIHFDAKYKVQDLQYLISEDNENISGDELNLEKLEQKEGTYKRADLLKMHAYKDAIRRTGGAYILYPGEKQYRTRGFHEIIPGLGAFPISPTDNNNEMDVLERFLLEVVDHFADRASQREEQSYSTYLNHKKDSDKNELHEIIPEQYGGEREKPPNKTFVLIGFIREKQKEWVKDNKLYNIRFDGPVDIEKIGAEYLLLYVSDNSKAVTLTSSIYRIIDNPEIWDKSRMDLENYPDPSSEEYFVYKIESINEPWTEGKVWDISKLEKYGKTKRGGPFSVSLAELMHTINN